MGNITLPIYFHSSISLEPWNWENPWTKGIGGSETSHIELSEILGDRRYNVISLAPISEYQDDLNHNVPWYHHSQDSLKEEKCIWIVYRNPEFFRREKPKGNSWWFIAQDVDYGWTPEGLKNVDRYICLCKTHARYTEERYPSLKGRIYISSNGIRRKVIENVEKESIPRTPYKMVYASSPDRGLLFILQNWFRITEAISEAELHIFYGFNNMESILEKQGGQASFLSQKIQIERLLTQPGVIWRGRIGQMELYREWFSAGVWPYPTDWPETSCVTCMDAQACGAIPVTNYHWAVGENVFYGSMLEGIPQHDPLLGACWVQECLGALQSPAWVDRRSMMQDARDTFDWEKIAGQWEGWIEEDSKL